ncbi:MAG: hypothetical protein L0241_16445 [Planctomycetia bacterium]|nr:hypothetical protein [Planctomycetia bacterium]
MDWRKRYLKLAAFLPAIILVGAFIGCRSGAFEMFSKREPMPEPHPLGLNVPNPPANQQSAEQPAPEKPPTFMSGTKSLNGVGVTRGLTPAGSSEQPAPTFIAGAKSAGIFRPPTEQIPTGTIQQPLSPPPPNSANAPKP